MSKNVKKNNNIIFKLDTKVYPLEAIYSAAYVFLDKAYIFLEGDPRKEIVVYLKGKKKINFQELEKLKGEFHNELLNYLLRVNIAKRNKKIREVIVGTAIVSSLSFSELPAEDSEDNYLGDPLGITVPWEEKYGKKKTKKKN